jgi:hypothetical protein
MFRALRHGLGAQPCTGLFHDIERWMHRSPFPGAFAASAAGISMLPLIMEQAFQPLP